MPSPLGFDGGLTATLAVTDLDAAMTWYEQTLGFTPLYKMDEMGWAEMTTELQGVNVGLSQVESMTHGGTTLTFGVRDLAVARAHLESLGVRFDGDDQVIPGMVALTTFYDPDGNTLMLYQDLSEGGTPS